jgi:phosphoribosyl 1,2-cyclic phosphodiesterase
MSLRFCVLGSGSKGNASLLLTPQAHLLIDAGFAPDELAARMEGTGASWETLRAVVLTHTHNDHVRKTCLRECAARGIALHCHAEHVGQIGSGRHLRKLEELGLLRRYEPDQTFEVAEGVQCRPLRLPHDAPPTFGFIVEALVAGERRQRFGYFADLGHWSEDLARHVRDLDLLALEFNHDEGLERESGRPHHLIARVLGTHGHLSNRQAAEALEGLLLNSPPERLRTLVQLHLSRECNRAELAYRSAQEVILRLKAPVEVFSSRQEQRGRVLTVT